MDAKKPSVLSILFGVSPSRALWGLRPADLGLLPRGRREEWFELIDPDDAHLEPSTWWNTAWHQLPRMRHIWGETQGDVHAGGQELFLDLIFVGVAYRVGEVMKSCFYSCTPYSAAAAAAAAAAASSSAAEGEAICLGTGTTLLHSLAPFLCMYTIWKIETSHRASYIVNSRLHAALDLAGNLLLIIAGMNMQPANVYREQRGVSLGLARVLLPAARRAPPGRAAGWG